MEIIALGGGGFSTGSEPGLDLYLLERCSRAAPRIGFVGTASGDDDAYCLRFYERFARLDCRPSHLGLFRRVPDVESWILGQDLIFVGGGNTRSMLAVWRAWGLPEILRRAAAAGTILAGASAGAICWFEQGVTDSEARAFSVIDGLGFASGSACPHWSGEPERRPAYERLVASGGIAPGFALDDGAALHLVAGDPVRVVLGRPDAEVYRVERTSTGARAVPVDGVERLVV